MSRACSQQCLCCVGLPVCLQLAGAEQHWFEGVSMEDKQKDAASAGVCAIRPLLRQARQGNLIAAEGQLQKAAAAAEAALAPCTHSQVLSTCWLLMDGLPLFFGGLAYALWCVRCAEASQCGAVVTVCAGWW